MQPISVRPRALAIATILLAVAACDDATAPVRPLAPEAPAAAAAPLAAASTDTALADTLIQGRRYLKQAYIVWLKPSAGPASAAADKILALVGGTKRHVFGAVRPGFAVRGLPDAAVAALSRNPLVAKVERDEILPIDGVQSLGTLPYWGLDYIDQHPATNWNWFTDADHQFKHFFDGAGVHVYVLDTGVRGDHVEFTGRLGNGTSTISIGNGPYEDVDGHGTGVAGQAVGTKYGVAKAATLHSVRVAYGHGVVLSDAIEGYQWVLSNVQRPAVVNQSFTTSPGTAYWQQVLISNGITVVAAAGNDNLNVCGTDDQPTNAAIIVGAVNVNLNRSTFSNYGACLDVWAPGEGTVSAAMASATDSTTSFGGTSGATPYVTGVAASALQEDPSLTPAQVETIIKESSTKNGIAGIPSGGGPNYFLNSLHRFVIVTGPGVIQINDPTYFTYNVVRRYGGDGTWSFQWMANTTQGANLYPTGGTGLSETHLFYPPADGHFDYISIGVNATSAGETVWGGTNVEVYPDCGGFGC
ncbi:MAG: S8 family peptidase [Gemmatirosa sp.]|nr:S8 family peptidase [Gemmatirosa sp.]